MRSAGRICAARAGGGCSRPFAVCYNRQRLNERTHRLGARHERKAMPAGSASKSTEFPYQLKIEVDKAPRPKDPKQLAVIDQTGCTGCEACIAFCPVDCIEI